MLTKGYILIVIGALGVLITIVTWIMYIIKSSKQEVEVSFATIGESYLNKNQNLDTDKTVEPTSTSYTLNSVETTEFENKTNSNYTQSDLTVTEILTEYKTVDSTETIIENKGV